MIRSLWTAGTGMIAQQQNVDVIGNNLANISTTGYKTEDNEFKSLLYQEIQRHTTTAEVNAKPIGAQAGLGVRTSSVTSKFSQGSYVQSHNPSSFALGGNGFFSVKGEDGNTYYTRNGNFTYATNAAGNRITLTDSAGNPVLSETGKEIDLPGNYIASNISYDEKGNLYYRNAETGETNQLFYMIAPGVPATYTDNRDGQVKNLPVQIGRYQFENPKGLDKINDSLFTVSEASGEAINEFNNPDITESEVANGYLEASNVQVAEEMVKLILAQRSYESNARMVTTSDSMLEAANRIKT